MTSGSLDIDAFIQICEGHYWDSLEKNKEMILVHLRAIRNRWNVKESCRLAETQAADPTEYPQDIRCMNCQYEAKYILPLGELVLKYMMRTKCDRCKCLLSAQLLS